MKDLRMRFFHFIKKHDSIRLPSNSLCQLSSLLITNISWRRTNQSGYRMLLHIFWHINSNQSILIIKQSICKRFCKLSLSYSSRSKEKEGSNWSIRIFKSSPRTANSIRYEMNSLFLSNDRFFQNFLKICEFLHLSRNELSNRDSCPLSNNLSNILTIYNILRGILLRFSF